MAEGIKKYTEHESRQSLTTSTVFCLLCGSEMVDVDGWESPIGANFSCSNCGHTAIVEGFTIGKVRRASGNKNLQEALKDAAFYNRVPEIKENFFEYWRRQGL